MLYYDRIDISKRIDLNKSNVNISDIAIMTIKNVDYCCIIHNISKSEAIILLENSVFAHGGYMYKKRL